MYRASQGEFWHPLSPGGPTPHASPAWPKRPARSRAAPGPTGDPRRRRVQADRRGESSGRRAEHPGRSRRAAMCHAGRCDGARVQRSSSRSAPWTRTTPATMRCSPSAPTHRRTPPCNSKASSAGGESTTSLCRSTAAGRAAQDACQTDQCVAASVSSASRRGSRPAPASHTTSLRAPAAITPTPQATPLRSPTHPAPRAGSAPSAPRQPSYSEYRRVVRLPGGYSFDMTPSSPPRSGASAPPRAAQCRDPVFHELHRPDEDGPHPRQHGGSRRVRKHPHLRSLRNGLSTVSALWPDRRSWHHWVSAIVRGDRRASTPVDRGHRRHANPLPPPPPGRSPGRQSVHRPTHGYSPAADHERPLPRHFKTGPPVCHPPPAPRFEAKSRLTNGCTPQSRRVGTPVQEHREAMSSFPFCVGVECDHRRHI